MTILKPEIQVRRKKVLAEVIRDPGKTGWGYGAKLGYSPNDCNKISCNDMQALQRAGLVRSIMVDNKNYYYPTDKALREGEQAVVEPPKEEFNFDRRAIKDALRGKAMSVKELCLTSQGYYKPSMFFPFKAVLAEMCKEGSISRSKIFPEVYTLVEKKAELPPPLYQSKPKPVEQPVSRDDLALQIADLLTKIPTGPTKDQEETLDMVYGRIKEAQESLHRAAESLGNLLDSLYKEKLKN